MIFSFSIRIIRLQPSSGVVQRSYCPLIGVKVVSVYTDQHKIDDHPLVGALVDFLDEPKFEGRNTILTEPGAEAIFPVHIQVKKDSNNGSRSFNIQRKFDDDMRFPPLNDKDVDKFKSLQAIFQSVSPVEIEDATGILDLSVVWRERVAKLQADLTKTTNEIEIAAIKSRIETMSNISPRRFSVRMLYSMYLTGNAIFEDPNDYLPGKPVGLGLTDPWTLELWCGAWDADAQSGYMVGYLGIPLSSSLEKRNDENGEVNNASTYFKHLSDMMDKPSKIRQ